MSRIYLIIIGLVALALTAFVSCDQPTARRGRTRATGGGDADAYLRSVAATLNDLAANVDLELLPAQPILTAANSDDGKEVRAICIENPRSPDGQFTYLRSTDGNADFVRLDVQPGDIVRYYANVDLETAERGIEQRMALEMRVRRLDAADPQNAIILQGGLAEPMTMPQRIEIWRFSDKRMDAIRFALNRYISKRQPPAGWEPAPDLGAIQQIAERANQWLRNQPAADEAWNPEPLIAELPADLRQARGVAKVLSEENLRNGRFDLAEGRLLAEAVWCRDISEWVRRQAEGQSDEEVAAALFDWTVRNVQLDGPEAPKIIHHPWQALMYSHGIAAHRAWVFVELCRHQRIDAVVLQPAAAEGKESPLLVGVLVEDQIHLFDPRLGLPLPGAAGGVATLAELAENDGLLRQLDVEGEEAYPLSSEQLKQVEAYIVASPLQLARRSVQLEGALEGDQYVQLAVPVRPIAERLAKHPAIKQVKLWTAPVQAIADENTVLGDTLLRAAAEFAPFAERPILWQARMLHFQGNKELRSEERNDPLAEPREGHRGALGLYQNSEVRLSDAKIGKLDAAKRETAEAAKSNASYWLGLLSYDLGNYDVAAEWLGERTLDQESKGRWASGARYNLARTYEKLQRNAEAIKLLQSDPKDAPQRQGNLLRARRLMEQEQKSAAGDQAPLP